MVSHIDALKELEISYNVLILIVMDNGLSPRDEVLFGGGTPVLILIVMDNGLSHVFQRQR